MATDEEILQSIRNAWNEYSTKGGEYNVLGKLNLTSWMGERTGFLLRENDRLLRRLEIETRLVEWMEKQAPDIFAQSDILMKRIEIGDELRGDY